MNDCAWLERHFPKDRWPGLADEFNADYMQRLCRFLREEYSDWGGYPRPSDVFKAFALTTSSTVRAVILGNDPYPDPTRAMGLAFSVPYSRQQRKLPVSLQRIYTAVERDLGRPSLTDGDLTGWAREEHILLLNTALTRGESGSHVGRGWECFTQRAIELLSEHRDGLVFLLWGKEARKRRQLIDEQAHHVLEADHPSAPAGNFLNFEPGRGPFSTADKHLARAVNW